MSVLTGTRSGSSLVGLLRRCDTYLFDCDGVLWNGPKLLPGASRLVEHLLQSDRTVFLITNNSSKSVEQYAKKCVDLGLPVTGDNVICSANVTANFLHTHGVLGPVYVIGSAGLGLELDKFGISHFGIGTDNPEDGNILQNVTWRDNTSGVVVGYDAHFNYRKLFQATTYISKGLPFFATNEDAQLPEGDIVLPGTGSIVASVRFASGKDPVVMGKPHQPTFDFLSKRHNLNPDRTIMVGDRLDTDILFGNRFGLHTACVLTGVTDAALLAKIGSHPADTQLRPSMTFPSVQELLETLRSDDR